VIGKPARVARFHGRERVVHAVCGSAARIETGAVHIREEVTMQTTVDRPKNHDADWLTGVAEDIAFIVMVFSGIVIVAAILALIIAL
jgi:hypothetical protein